MAQEMAQDWFTQNAPTTTGTPTTQASGGDWFAQNAPTEPTFKTHVRASDGVEGEDTGGLSGFARELWERINPIAIAQGLYGAAKDIPGTVAGMGQAQGALFEKAKEAAARGDYVTAARHGLHYLIPILGPDMDVAADMLAEGRYAEGAGAMTGMAANIAAPAVLARGVGAVRSRPLMRNPNPAEAAAVEFAEQQGIPVDAGTATGNAAVRGTQWLADRSIAGSLVSRGAKQTEAQALTRTGGRLADRAHPSPVVPEQAGQGVRETVEGRVRGFKREADVEYRKLRDLEADPANLDTVTRTEQGRVAGGGSIPVQVSEQIPMAVDLRAVKAAIRPIYQRMIRQLPQTQARASQGLKAMENVISGPDFAPFSQADMDLSAIKALARGEDLPELRTLSQGLAAAVVKPFEQAVRARVRRVGPDAVDILLRGRTAIRNKVDAGKVLKTIREEPVQAFNQAVYAKDAGIRQLRAMQRHAPQEMAKVGRAYLEQLLAKATSKGGFDSADAIWSSWDNLGPQTKRILFGPELTADLDKFFLVAKKLGENPNPSGSAFVGALGAQGYTIMSNPALGLSMQIGGATLSKALRSRRVVQLLTKGMTLPASKPAAAAATAAELARIMREAGVSMSPAGAVAGPEAGTSKQ